MTKNSVDIVNQVNCQSKGCLSWLLIRFDCQSKLIVCRSWLLIQPECLCLSKLTINKSWLLHVDQSHLTIQAKLSVSWSFLYLPSGFWKLHWICEWKVRLKALSCEFLMTKLKKPLLIKIGLNLN